MAAYRHLTLLLAMACAGCAPIPHIVTLVPDITGTLTLDGLPMANHEVRIGRGPADSPCSVIAAKARTNADGKFHLPRRTQLRFMYAPLVSPLSVAEFTLCVEMPGQPLLAYQGLVRLYGAAPLKLSCELHDLKREELRRPPDLHCRPTG